MFDLVLLLSLARCLLLSVGEELVRAGRLDTVEDLFFLTLVKVHKAVGGKDMHVVVREHRASYARELRRQPIPRLLLSEGTEPEVVIQRDGEVEGHL